MNCLKCGRATVDSHIFCNSCRENMERYPVAPGVAVTLPNRSANTTTKKVASRKRPPSVEEQLQSLRKALRRSRLLALTLLLVLGMVTAFFLHEIMNSDDPVIGQNYTIDINLSSD